ncbi:MAG TPA: tetratricopeptide repeat protein [Verrucomicrobiae bacterium]|nr:tetratricopeptide repeat protein [Verrucomicrobiae bacterium]
MQSDVTQVAFFYRLWAWFESHRKQAVQGAVVVVIIAFGVSFYLWRQSEREASLSQKFAATLLTQPTATSEFLSLAKDNPDTSIAAHALLVAAGNLFAQGKYPEAQTEFQNFAQNYQGSQFTGAALLGIASCLEAQNKTDAAIAAYQNLITHYPNDISTLQAKFGLARLYESQNKLGQAVQLYEEVARSGGMGTIASEAAARAHDLRAKLPASSQPSNSSSGTSTFDLKQPQ